MAFVCSLLAVSPLQDGGAWMGSSLVLKSAYKYNCYISLWESSSLFCLFFFFDCSIVLGKQTCFFICFVLFFFAVEEKVSKQPV